jgi:hypothetical protein
MQMTALSTTKTMKELSSRSGRLGLIALTIALLAFAGVGVAAAGAGDALASTDDVSLAQSDDPAINTTERTVESTTLRPGQTTTVEMTVVMEEDEFSLDDFELVELEDAFSPAFADVEAVEVAPGGGSGSGSPANDEFYAVWNEEALTYSVTYEVTVPDDAENGDQFDISGSFSAGDVQIDLPSETITVSTDLTGVELQPSDTTIPTEEQAVFDVVATGADSGVGSYSLNVSASDTVVGELTDVSVMGQPATDNSSVSEDGSSAFIEADMGDNDFAAGDEIVIAELTVEAGGVGGETDLTFEDGATVSDGSESAYSLDYTGDATLSVADLDPAFFEITEFSIPGEVEVGSSFDVSATITNTGEVSATKEISLLVNGNLEPTQSVTLDSGASESVTFTDIAIGTLGDFEVAIETGDQNVSQTVSVKEDLGPSVADYTNDQNVVEVDGLRSAIGDWRTGEIETGLLREVIGAWRSGDPVE